MDEERINKLSKEDAKVYRQLHNRNNELLTQLESKGIEIKPLAQINDNVDLTDNTSQREMNDEIKEIYSEFSMNINQMKEIISKYNLGE